MKRYSVVPFILVMFFLAPNLFAQHPLHLDDGAGNYSLINAPNPGGTYTLPPGGGTLITSTSLGSLLWLTGGNTGASPNNQLGTLDATDMQFITGGLANIRMLISGTTGFIGVGTSSPTHLFEINGTADATDTDPFSSSNWDLAVTGDIAATGIIKSGAGVTIDGVSIPHEVSADQPFHVYTNNGDLTLSTGIPLGGDINLNPENIVNVQSQNAIAETKIHMMMNPNFGGVTWDAGISNTGQLGFIESGFDNFGVFLNSDNSPAGTGSFTVNFGADHNGAPLQGFSVNGSGNGAFAGSLTIGNIPSASASLNILTSNAGAIEQRTAASIIGSTSWVLTGNTLSGGTPNTPNEWLGSSNDYDVVFRSNNAEVMRVTDNGHFTNALASNPLDAFGQGIASNGLLWEVAGDGYAATLSNADNNPGRDGLLISIAENTGAARILDAQSNGTTKFLVSSDGATSIFGPAILVGANAPLNVNGTDGTSGDVLLSNGAGATPSWTSLSPIAVTSVVGTANQVLANGTSGTNQTGTVTLTTPQDIATTSDVTFNSATLSSMTASQPVRTDGANKLVSGAINLAGGTTEVTGTLPFGNGGTGSTTYTANTALIVDPTNTSIISLANGGGNTVLHGTTPPSYSAIGTTDISGGANNTFLTTDGGGAVAWAGLNVGTGLTGDGITTALTNTGVLSVSGTANRISSTGGQNPVIDIDAAYVGQASITTLGTITTGVWNGTTVAVANGGTGHTSFTSNGVLYGNAGGAINVTAQGAAGTVLHGNGGAPTFSAVGVADLTPGANNTFLTTDGGGAVAWTGLNVGTGLSGDGITTALTNTGVLSVIGTANQVLANGTSGSNQTGSVTLTTPQDIATTSDVTFNSTTLSSMNASQPVRTDGTNKLVSGAINLAGGATEVTATLPFANGGTGSTTYTANTALIVDPTNTSIISLANGGGNTVLHGTTPPTYSAIGTTDISGGANNTFLTTDGGGAVAWTGLSVGTGISGDGISSPIANTGVLDVSGTLDRITSTGGQNPVIDIASTYVGQESINTLGVITDGVWNATTIDIAYGGTGQTTPNAAFDALSPMTTFGDMMYEDATPTAARLAGNTTTAKMFLSQTGTGVISDVPVWSALSPSDVSNGGWALGGNTAPTSNILGTLDATDLNIVTGSGGPNTRLFISGTTGDIGIGSATPTHLFEINGTSNANTADNFASPNWDLAVSGDVNATGIIKSGGDAGIEIVGSTPFPFINSDGELDLFAADALYLQSGAGNDITLSSSNDIILSPGNIVSVHSDIDMNLHNINNIAQLSNGGSGVTVNDALTANSIQAGASGTVVSNMITGTATLAAGTVVVNPANSSATSVILLTPIGADAGMTVYISARGANTFTISSDDNTDTRQVMWMVIN